MEEKTIPIWWFRGNFDLLTEQHIRMKLNLYKNLKWHLRSSQEEMKGILTKGSPLSRSKGHAVREYSYTRQRHQKNVHLLVYS